MADTKTVKQTVFKILMAVLAGIVLILAARMWRSEKSHQTDVVQQTDQENRQEADILFSEESGAYEEAFFLELKADAGTVFFTLDGSDPSASETRTEYNEPIEIAGRSDDENLVSAVNPVLFDSVNVSWDEEKKEYTSTVSVPDKEDVDKLTVVKAVVRKEDGSYSPVQTNSYFIGSMAEHIRGIEESCKASGMELAVMSISMEYDDLFDSGKGIYVKGDIFEEALAEYQEKKEIYEWEAVEVCRRMDANYKQRGKEWERRAHIDYFESDGSQTVCKLQQDCGIRIQGNYSRSDLQKGFRLRADSDYGENDFVYSFFGDRACNDQGEAIDHFKKLVLRNGGNCAFNTKYSDAYWQSMLQDMNVETQASRPCVVYLNGEYWGLYILQEDYDDNYFEETHGVNKDYVVAYKGDAETYQIGYKLDEGEIPEGEGVSYYFEDLLDFYRTHDDLKSDEDYREFTSLVDAESVRDYFAVNIWINNKWDWPGKNWTAWKVTKTDESNPYADGRWRLCMYDLDFGGISGASEAYANTVKEDNYKEYGLLDRDTGNPVVLMYVYLMSNEAFREDFIARLKSLSEEEFESERATNNCTRFKDTYEPLYHQFYTRYMGKDAAGYVENAVTGSYASYSCIVDFIKERKNHIQDMVDWIEEHYEDRE